MTITSTTPTSAVDQSHPLTTTIPFMNTTGTGSTTAIITTATTTVTDSSSSSSSSPSSMPSSPDVQVLGVGIPKTSCRQNNSGKTTNNSHHHLSQQQQQQRPTVSYTMVDGVVDLTQEQSMTPPSPTFVVVQQRQPLSQQPQPQPQHLSFPTTTTTTAQRQLSSSASSSSSRIINPYEKKRLIGTLDSTTTIVASENMKIHQQNTITTTTTTTTKKKFIGGAEAARQKAHHDLFDHWDHKKKVARYNNKNKNGKSKAPPTRIVRPGETINNSSTGSSDHPTNRVPQQQFQQYRNLFERFFHAVLRWPIKDYIKAAKIDKEQKNHNNNSNIRFVGNCTCDASIQLWDNMCRCLQLSALPLLSSDHSSQRQIQSKYDDLISHCNIRTIVLLEEVRNALCVAIYNLHSQCPLTKDDGNDNNNSSNINHNNNNNNNFNSSNNHNYRTNTNFNSNSNNYNKNKNSSSNSNSGSNSKNRMTVQIVAIEPCVSNTNYNNNKKHRPDTTNNNQQQTNENKVNYKITIRSPEKFSIHQLLNIRPSSIVIIGHGTGSEYILGVITTGNREIVEEKQSFEIMIFNCDSFIAQIEINTIITVTYLTQLVTELRCYEALNTNYKLHFEEHLLGHPDRLIVPSSPTHTRFYDSDDDDPTIVDVQCTKLPLPDTNHGKHNIDNNDTDNEYFVVPKLNPKQNDAATQFLESPSNTITLVQGPPGTGKSTLLVTVICKYLLRSLSKTTHVGEDIHSLSKTTNVGEDITIKCVERRRIMVCAPTNKAVFVLASRFMRCMNQGGDKKLTPFHIILVGDADKIFMDDRGGNGRNKNDTNHRDQRGAGKQEPLTKEQLELKSIFLYTWVATIISGYTRILEYFNQKSNETISTLLQLSRELQQRTTNGLTRLPDYILRRMTTIVSILSDLNKNSTKMPKNTKIIKDHLKEHIDEFKKLPKDVVLEQLLSNANVIFCTLASAGGTIVKKTVPIDDLIVDEAAASTEPEMYIPFHLQPKRLLAVGDPLQLPATVLSRRAISLGYDKSLHERLMIECKYDHIMLNVQYRMNPEISSFPSYTFYKNEIQNGDNVAKIDYTSEALLLDKKPYTFIQVEGQEEQRTGGSYYNKMEAKVVVDLISDLQRKAMTNTFQSWCSADRIRVITFYQAQVSHIQDCLGQRGLGSTVTVATVDSSQGCEADIVIISFVRSQGNSGDEWDGSMALTLTQSLTRASRTIAAGFLTDNRRMNVALTRAKYQLICVGNIRQFDQMPKAETLQLLAENAYNRGIIKDFSTDLRQQASKRPRHCFNYT